MKRFLKKHGKSILTAVGITAATIAAYLLAHGAATTDRGYEAIGGEAFIFVIPILAVWLAPKAKEAVKAVKDDAIY